MKNITFYIKLLNGISQAPPPPDTIRNGGRGGGMDIYILPELVSQPIQYNREKVVTEE